MVEKNATADAPKKAVDLTGLDADIKKQEEGIVIELKGMDGKTPLGVSVRVAGPDSDRQVKALAALTDEYLDRQESVETTAAELDRRSLILLAKSTIEWTPVVLDGVDLPYSEENAIKLYSRFRFIREQVEKKASTRKAFTKS